MRASIPAPNTIALEVKIPAYEFGNTKIQTMAVH